MRTQHVDGVCWCHPRVGFLLGGGLYEQHYRVYGKVYLTMRTDGSGWVV